MRVGRLAAVAAGVFGLVAVSAAAGLAPAEARRLREPVCGLAHPKQLGSVATDRLLAHAGAQGRLLAD